MREDRWKIHLKSHLYELPVMLQLFLECLDMLVEVFRMTFVLQLCLEALRFPLFQFSLQNSKPLRQRAVVLLRLPLQVQPILGQLLCLCK